ncbi:MAG: DNA-binding protein, partial [Acidimicrobiales bacterium]
MLLDVITEDERWLEWSSNALARAADDGGLFINPIIYAEVSVRFSHIEDLEETLPPSDYGRLAVPWESATRAGVLSDRDRVDVSASASPFP